MNSLGILKVCGFGDTKRMPLYRYSIALVLGLVLISGCSTDEPKALKTEVRYSTGAIYCRGQFDEIRKLWNKKLIRSGEWIWYYPNGNEYGKTVYGDEGEIISDCGFYGNGNLEWEREFSEEGEFETNFNEGGDIRWKSSPIKGKVDIGSRIVNWDGTLYSEYHEGRVFFERYDFETNLKSFVKIYGKDGTVIHAAFTGDDFYKDHIVVDGDQE